MSFSRAADATASVAGLWHGDGLLLKLHVFGPHQHGRLDEAEIGVVRDEGFLGRTSRARAGGCGLFNCGEHLVHGCRRGCAERARSATAAARMIS